MEDHEIYSKCKQLSLIGDCESLNELMNIYLSASDSQTKKDARKALKKATNRKAVISIILNAIDKASNNEKRLDLLFTGQLIYRVKFLYDYLVEVARVKGKIQRTVLEEMSIVSPFTAEEMDEMVRYIIETNDYSVIVYRYLDNAHREIIINRIKELIDSGEINAKMLTLIHEDDEYLLRVQDSLKNYMATHPFDCERILPYVKIESEDDATAYENLDNLFSVYRALLRSKYNISNIETDNLNVKISLAVINGNTLSDDLWYYIKEQISNEITSTTDISIINNAFFLFLRGLVKIDIAYTERIYITLYERTGLYSNRILSEMIEMSIPYAYRLLTNRLITVNNNTIRRKTIAKLLKYYSVNAMDTYTHVLQLNDEALIDYTKEIANKYGVSIIVPNEAVDDLIYG